MSRAWVGGSTRAWRRVRALVLDANRMVNDGRCALALDGKGGRSLYPGGPARTCPKHGARCSWVGCTRYADTVHHTRGRAVTGDDPRYLAATCTACNAHVGEPATNTSTVDPAGRSVTQW